MTSTDTTSSDKSLYFDAPITHFNMEQPNPGDFLYIDGNWVANSTTGTRSPSPAASAAPVEGGVTNERRRTISASINGAPRRGRNSIRSVRTVGSTFANGAGTIGPAATPDLDKRMRARAMSADASLTAKQRSKIVKEECTCELCRKEMYSDFV
jgi:hypothetical protein